MEQIGTYSGYRGTLVSTLSICLTLDRPVVFSTCPRSPWPFYFSIAVMYRLTNNSSSLTGGSGKVCVCECVCVYVRVHVRACACVCVRVFHCV